MNSNIKPSLLIPEVFFPVKREKNLTAEVLEKVLGEDGFYKSVELGDGFEAEERKRIQKVVNSSDVEVTQWFTFLLEENGLDVSSTNGKLRKASVDIIKNNLGYAAEINTKNIAIVTGENPTESKREEALEGLFESLCEIAEACDQYGMKILIEPLDRFAHKKRVLGTTEETIDLLSKVKKHHSNIGIAFDTAHAALNEEDLMQALEEGKDLIEQIHFSNAVLNKSNTLYGDYHIPIGSPGFLTIGKIEKMLTKMLELGIKKEEGIRAACEVRGKTNKENCFSNERELRQIMKEAINRIKK